MVLVMILVNLSKNEILRFEAKVTKLEEYDGTRVFNTKIIVTDCNFDTKYDNYNKILNSLNDMKKIVKKKNYIEDKCLKKYSLKILGKIYISKDYLEEIKSQLEYIEAHSYIQK